MCICFFLVVLLYLAFVFPVLISFATKIETFRSQVSHEILARNDKTDATCYVYDQRFVGQKPAKHGFLDSD